MTLLRSLSLPFHPDQSVRLRGTTQQNRVSVLLGVNGTQKSSILRGLLEDALVLGPSDKRPSGTLSCGTKWVSDPPARVVAVSSAATDRFPSRSVFGESRILTRYDVPEYAYVGPRTGRNLVSRSQSVQSLLTELLQLHSVHPQVADFIATLSWKTTVPRKLRLQLSRRPYSFVSERYSTPTTLKKFLDSVGSVPGLTRHRRFDELLDRAHRDVPLMREADRLFKLLHSQEESLVVELDLSNENPVIAPRISGRAIHFALSVGFMRIEDVRLLDEGRDGRRPDTYSAGQWGLFSSLATAALAARDRALLLIDEPENALHPAWQREYIALLQQGIAHCKGCHVVLATHSPLIVSGLGAKDADLLGLKLRADHSVELGLLEVPVGWQATDVLEDIFGLPSTRSPSVVEEIESAMTLIAKGAAANAVALRKVAKRLEPLLETLPEDDVARQIIGSICRVSEAQP